jgi:hypothetical protein
MTSDERTKSAFDTLATHLRQEIGQQVQGVLDELAAAALADRDRAIADARSQMEREAKERLAGDVALAETRGRHEGHAAGREAAEKEAAEREAAAKEVAEKEGAAREAAAKEAAEKRTEEAAAVAPPAESLGPDAAASHRLVDAIQAIGRARSLSDILDTLVNCAAREAERAAVFLVRGGRFRAWKFVGFGPALDEDNSLECGFDEAGVMGTAARTNATATGDGGDAATAPAFTALAPGHSSIAVPIAFGGDVVAVLYADQGTHGVWTAAVEVIARHAARSLEALTAFKAARAIMEPNGSASGAATNAADEDASAQRYARLLVSEIKLYHEAAVVQGRLEGDLGRRLSEEIARARELYEQRVPPAVRQRADYFHDELVRTLANGDGGLLGM